MGGENAPGMLGYRSACRNWAQREQATGRSRHFKGLVCSSTYSSTRGSPGLEARLCILLAAIYYSLATHLLRR